MEEKDWILDNIRSLIKETGIKEEYISSHIGISQGEFSKILCG